MDATKKILFPCDLSQQSHKVAPYVVSMAQKFDSAVHVLHVIPNRFFAPAYGITNISESSVFTSVEEDLRSFCQKHLAGCKDIHTKAVLGMPATEILKYAAEEQIDLVIMGSHGHTGLEHTLFGSVAENVVKKSPIPVLIINVGKQEDSPTAFWSE